ncbi:hypothetical protein GJ631_14620 [Natronomonas sp. CBA1123]|uniref:hypothetical protein n=1 Tax=Natronomonas sp. CBA1123 TaxID=2668070 RepID=UPI0012EA30E1|nr:hypothetical protein [Natronomonas sp. CBA1123]MUV87750.1 hypothetical protein [Natronomonas sp. CBA1123]
MGWGNNRAVSEVLGAILLFGIVVLALGSYQAFVVPQQNAEIESNHDAQVSNEFAEIQPAISNAAASGRTRTTSVTLGTRYPVRAAALNPPTVSGQLSTGASGDLRVEHDSRIDACALTDDRPNTTSIRYNANYNELDNTGAMVYENGVTYRETDGGILQRTDQQLVDGSTIRLYPLVAEQFSTGSSSSEQLRFVPGETGVRIVDVDSGEELDITFPSRLDEDGWNRILSDADGFDTADDSGDTVTVTLSPDEDTTYTIRCTPVGLGSAPEQGAVPNDEEEGDEANQINPNDEDEIVLVDTSDLSEGGSKTTTLTFEDRTDAGVEAVGGRVNYYYISDPGKSGNKPTTMEFDDSSNKLDIEGQFDTFDSHVELSESGPTDVTITFDKKAKGDHFYVLTLEFSNGDVNTYFISH